ncbi:ParB/RepB/Spo0J family partition protein [Mycobacteroides abscessus]|uniref:ParB-like partition protein n=1 Tax=Mycobacteroides abscessus TaxID=36809 RepID=A0A0U0ZRI0_9MYCO|nr:chromosome partitioning protein ParB [Mycobacteroides abscessus]CPV66998.1 ParB-like partition protein [Mycobacteroides abscessus]
MTTDQARKTAPRRRMTVNGTGGSDRRSASRVGTNTTNTKHSGMLDGLTAAEAEAQGLQVIEVAPKSLIPNPFNDPTRSTVSPDDPDGLLQSVQADGVAIPGWAVTRDAFDKRWPGELDPDLPGKYVLTFGHRRHAASLETGRPTMPIIVKDSILESRDGGLLLMYQENHGRLALTPVALAQLLAAFIDKAGYTQAELAEQHSVNQSTISRSLALLLLAPTVQEAVNAGEFSPTLAASLGSKLPYGPVRSWQKAPDAARQCSAERLADQLRAFKLLTASKKRTADSEDGAEPAEPAEPPATIGTVIDRVLAERRSRSEAQARGLTIVDPVEHFGNAGAAQKHRIYDDVDDPTGLIAGLDDRGELTFYATEENGAESRSNGVGGTPGPTDENPADHHPEDHPGREKPGAKAAPKTPDKAKSRDGKQSLTASRNRREAIRTIVSSPPPKPQLLQILADQYALGVARWSSSDDASQLADEWGVELAASAGAAERIVRAWALALAGYELHTLNQTATWEHPQQLFYKLLAERAQYSPSGWEREQLDLAG